MGPLFLAELGAFELVFLGYSKVNSIRQRPLTK
jgi:hypothetical protein